MKPRFFTPALLTILGLAVSASSFAQTENYIASNHSSHSPAEPAASYSIPAKPIATTVVEEGFAKRYPQATDAKWIKLEKGFQASFMHAGQKTMAVFSNQGKFSYAITELDADKLPAEVSSFIKKEYPGHNLIQAVSIRDNNHTIYQTILQQGASYIKIKSIGEDMEVSVLQNRPIVQ